MSDNVFVGKKVKVVIEDGELRLKLPKKLLKELSQNKYMYWFDFSEGIILAKHQEFEFTEMEDEEEDDDEVIEIEDEDGEIVTLKKEKDKLDKEEFRDLYR